MDPQRPLALQRAARLDAGLAIVKKMKAADAPLAGEEAKPRHLPNPKMRIRRGVLAGGQGRTIEPREESSPKKKRAPVPEPRRCPPKRTYRVTSHRACPWIASWTLPAG